MKKKQLISLEKLEYDVYKNENDIKIKKIITLDEYFKISIISNKYDSKHYRPPCCTPVNTRGVWGRWPK